MPQLIALDTMLIILAYIYIILIDNAANLIDIDTILILSIP
jgi:hypothetical protein